MSRRPSGKTVKPRTTMHECFFVTKILDARNLRVGGVTGNSRLPLYIHGLHSVSALLFNTVNVNSENYAHLARHLKWTAYFFFVLVIFVVGFFLCFV